MNYPFHYEVRCKILAFDKNNNVSNKIFKREFRDADPLEGRKNAFREFDDIISDLEFNSRIAMNSSGNYYIVQPDFIKNRIIDTRNSEITQDFWSVSELYKEEISLEIVVDDIDVLKELNVEWLSSTLEITNELEVVSEMTPQNTFEIHKVASFDYEEQDCVDNLEMIEVELYKLINVNIEDYITTVYHYGVDFGESGEDVESGAKRVILKTPHIWRTIEEYNAINDLCSSKEVEVPSSSKEVEVPTLEHIIKVGESDRVEFKPCLLYSFNTQKASISVKYLIAKAICAFLNSEGGGVIIGVKDNGEIQGLKYDYSLFEFENRKDKLLLEVDSLISYFFDYSIKPLIKSSFENVQGKEVLVIGIHKSPEPIFLRNKKDGQVQKEFFVRMTASTRQIVDVEAIIKYVLNRKSLEKY
jgi:hypothetical protein